MAGSGPDFVNAAVGAAFGGFVGPSVDGVINVLKYVFHCREECNALREYLEDLKPLMDEVSKRKEVATTNWLNGFVELLKEADGLVKTCKSDSSELKDRSKEIFHGNKILGLKERIQVKVSLSPMVLLAHNSASMSNFQQEGTLQQVPCKILGMEDHFNRVKLSIIEGHASESSSCVGIQGMGGGGKTLLAKMVNNDRKIQDLFGSASILWVTVGRDASIPAIYDQMRDRLDVRCAGGSLEDQQTHLMNEFSRRRILLILDDVWDNVHEYKEVVEWLNVAEGPGSVTLITTRMQSITRSFVNARMEVILRLSEEQSWELFCTHAFGTDRLPSNKAYLERLVKDVCKECKCLPLALKVVGIAMKGKCDIAEWRRTLNRLQNSSMINKSVDEQLFERLRTSYDELDKSTKVCFIYFAAFPEDCEIPVEHLCEIWVVEALFGKDLEQNEAMDEACCALNELRRRCLIENCVGEYGEECVKMHDILRDLAIHMSSEGEECARDSLFMLNRKDVKEFPASWLTLPLEVKRMSIWGNKMKRFSSNFIAPFLRICMLYPESWREGYGNDLSDCQECTIEDDFFKHLDALRYLQLCCNHDLQRLPECIGGLGSLQHLNLSRCDALKELPESIRGLRCLRHLNLSWCGALKELPESMGGLRSLQHLNLSGCGALKELPESIGGLGSLQHLHLAWFLALKELPESNGGLQSLKYLSFFMPAYKMLPVSMGGLRSLHHLRLIRCYELKELPKSFGGLGSSQHLDLSRFSALEQIPESIGGLGSLQILDLECVALKELPQSIGGLVSLQFLYVVCCTALKELPQSIGGLVSLQYLYVVCCTALKELPESIGGLGSLQHLSVSRCEALVELPKSIGGLVSLQHLDVSQCDALMELPESIGGLGSLQHLDLSRCHNLKELPESIGELGPLQHLDLSRCHNLKELPGSIGGLGFLHHLYLSGCDALKELPESIGGLGSLQYLDLLGCDALKELPGSIGGLGSLQYLVLVGCDALKKLPESIGGLGSLEHLDLSGCDALKELPESIGGLGSLEHLDLSGCDALKELPGSIGGLGSLRYLDLSGCDALKGLPESIGGLGSLQHLNLSGCEALKELPESIGGLGSLQYLNVSECHALKGVPRSIGSLVSLRHLNLKDCSAFELYLEFSKFPQLQIIF